MTAARFRPRLIALNPRRPLFAREACAFIACCLLSSGTSACTTRGPSAELIRARQAFAEASGGETQGDALEALERARRALAEAETALVDGRDSDEARDLAYTALRRIELAQARARIVAETVRRDGALARTHAR